MTIGDCITPHIIETVFGYRPVSMDGNFEHVLGVGSVFFLANDPGSSCPSSSLSALPLFARIGVNELGHGVAWPWGNLDDVTAVLIRPAGKRNGERHVVFCV